MTIRHILGISDDKTFSNLSTVSRHPFSIPQFTSLHHTSLNPTNALKHSHIHAFKYILPFCKFFVLLQHPLSFGLCLNSNKT